MPVSVPASFYPDDASNPNLSTLSDRFPTESDDTYLSDLLVTLRFERESALTTVLSGRDFLALFILETVMNFYFDAAKILDKLDTKQGSVKGVIATIPEKDRKRTAALVIETLKYKDVLSDVIRNADLLKHERQKLTSINLILLLVHDLLFSKGKIQAGDGPIKQAILRHKTRLQSELTKIKVKRGVQSVSELAQGSDSRADQIPRYVRINTLIWSTEDAVSHFLSHGYEEQGDPLLCTKALKLDCHVPDLLLFHPSISFNDTPLLDSGKIILQDKASCLPAVILSPPADSDTYVIDATAAPGNKTTFLSALMKGRGKLYAFERDKKRFVTLKKMVARARSGNVEPMKADFLTVNPYDSKYARVSHILVDPSCSGSGIVNRLDHLLESEDENNLNSHGERLQKLAAFQLKILKHAMKFPEAEKIVYSTCSIHAVENEGVVLQALAAEEAKIGKFVLADRKEVLPEWPRRGIPEEMREHASVASLVEADSLIRCIPGEDHTNGFFVACFVRAKVKCDPDAYDVSGDGGSELYQGGESLSRHKKRPAERDDEEKPKPHGNVEEHQAGDTPANRCRPKKKRSKS